MTITINITREAALKAVKAVVDENPHRTNGGHCQYVHQSQPNCIAAVALSRLGVPTQVMDWMEGHNFREISWGAINDETNVDIDIAEDAIEFLDALQSRADNTVRDAVPLAKHYASLSVGQVPWGKALNAVITEGA